MKHQISILIGICLLFAAAHGQSTISVDSSFKSISKEEIEMLLADVAKNNPKVLERLMSDPEMRRLQVQNLKQLLAFASQAERDGLAAEPTNRQELDNIRAETLAVKYDREVNRGKAELPAFGYITEKQIAAYWAQRATAGHRTHQAEFDDFLEAKLAIFKANNPALPDVSQDEIAQARDLFAKVRIYKAEFDRAAKTRQLNKAFVDDANLQVKLQQAQFLARLYADKNSASSMATAEEVASYIAKHPELDPAAKRAKAEQILTKAKAGEDFASLANEYTDDPGNKGADGELQGGFYKDVAQGKMIPEFEKAALALQPGQVAPAVVESDFGYHIIKLENKRSAKDGAGHDTQIYDVRHILISTGYKDPDDPNGRQVPLKEYVRNIIETDKESRLVEKLIADNNIRVAEDFTVPAPESGQQPTAVKHEPVKKKRTMRKGRH